MKLINKIIEKVSKRVIKDIRPILRETVQNELEHSNHNLKVSMQRMASEQSAEFLVNNVPLNLDFRDRYELLTHVSQFMIEKGLHEAGAVLEFGVWKGSTINHMSEKLPNLKFYGFDSFEGLTEPWIYNDPGAFGNLKSLPKVNDNVKLVKGFFDSSLPNFLENFEEEIKLLHIDCDLYSSTKCVFENLSYLLKPGLIIVFDEFFNYPGWKDGEYKAWIEIVTKLNLKFEYLGYTYQKNDKFKSGQQLALQLV